MRDDRQRLIDILEAVAQIEKHSSQGKEGFEKSELVQVWVLHHLQVIGEAASRVSRGFQSRHPQVPWQEIIAMRNILVHQYFNVDLDEVWNTVQNDLPGLRAALQAILS